MLLNNISFQTILIDLARRKNSRVVNWWATNSLLKTSIRKSIGLNRSGSPPIQVVSGRQAPKLSGQSFYFTNKKGDIIRFPNAYRTAWGKPIYHKSSRRIEVGRNWLLKNYKKSEIPNYKCYICNSDFNNLSDHSKFHLEKYLPFL